jgi:RbcX protein
MDIPAIAKATAKTLSSYLTYQAFRTVFDQLNETDPPQAYWLHNFSSQGKIQNGELYIEELLQARPELAFRIMTVRAHLAQEIADFLPELVRSTVEEGNLTQRRRYYERLTYIRPDISGDTHADST